jgi:hypothetical protein
VEKQIAKREKLKSKNLDLVMPYLSQIGLFNNRLNNAIIAFTWNSM